MVVNEQFSVIGKSVTRIDALEKVTGQAKYCTDVNLPGMLHAKVLRSPHPHAKIVSIDTSKAEKLPGVRCIITGKDIPRKRWGFLVWDQTVLAQDVVRCVGDPVAAVAADTIDIAEEALDLIDVKYEPLPAIFDPEEAMSPNPPVIVHPDLFSYQRGTRITPELDLKMPNVFNHFKIRKGDVAKGFRRADLVMENRFSTVKVNHCFLETPVTVARPDADGGVTVWAGKQMMWPTKSDIERLFDLPPDKVRIIQLYVGGSFGGKGSTREEPIPVLLALKTGKPVKHVFTREETFARISSQPVITYIKDGVKKDGRLVAREMRIIMSTGGYDDSVSYNARAGALGAVGTYRVPNFKCDSYAVCTNLTLSTGLRGVGNQQVQFAIESHMDMLAEKLGIDPVEIRMKNILKEGEANVTGEITHSIGVRDCLDKVARCIKLDEKPANNGVWRKGKGLAIGNKHSAAGSADMVRLEVKKDGTISLYHGVDELGEGCNTTLAQIAAEILSISVDKVQVIFGDTRCCPISGGSGSSLNTYRTGNSAKLASENAKKQLFERAARKLGVASDDLKTRRGVIYVKGKPRRKVSFAELCSPDAGGEIVSTGAFMQEAAPQDKKTGQIEPSAASSGKRLVASWAHTAKAVEVAVNSETGEVRVLRFATANDMGRPINPKVCEQQAEGGMGMSIGDAIYEEMVVKDGVIVNPNFTDYRIPSVNEMPTNDNVIMEMANSPHKDGPFGAKGFAEGVLVGTAPAIANAVYNAVGVRIKDLPITAEKVLQELKKQRK